MTRTFIALEMHQAAQRHLAEIIQRAARALPTLRWVDPAGIHLTLAFLGELTDEQLAQAMQAAEITAERSGAFSYRHTQLGIFGSPRQPRVIWMGIEEPSGSLLQLHRTLSRELKLRGFALEARPFSPHLTLARVKNPLLPEELQALQWLLSGKHFDAASPASYQVEHITVMKSELSRAGVRYTPLELYPLGKRS
ncbi:MAG: RNA 2',3'-cyclic phosphodiesterase [Ktedonobacteraceae bacterium]|nr:RNA 2',3'-cyclic phosphodiesterase [Ktedonobacteraceae bacterium]